METHRPILQVVKVDGAPSERWRFVKGYEKARLVGVALRHRSFPGCIRIYDEKLHTVVSTHLLYVGSNCCKAQGLDESVEDRLNLNTAPQFGTLVVPHCLYKKDCC